MQDSIFNRRNSNLCIICGYIEVRKRMRNKAWKFLSNVRLPHVCLPTPPPFPQLTSTRGGLKRSGSGGSGRLRVCSGEET